MSGVLALAVVSASMLGHCDPEPAPPHAGMHATAAGGDGIRLAAVAQAITTPAQAANWPQGISAHTGTGTLQAPAQTSIAIELGTGKDRPPIETGSAPPARPTSGALASNEPARQAPAGQAADVEPDTRTPMVPNRQLLLLDMTVNGRHRGPALMMLDERGILHAQADTLSDWGMREAAPGPVEVAGRQFHGFGSLPGVRTAVETRDMSATAQIPARYLVDTTRSLSWRPLVPPRADHGAFMDYSLAYTDDPGLGARQASGLLSPTVFTDRGNLSAGFLYRDTDPSTPMVHEGMLRLDTTWTSDFPDRLASLRIGDALTPQNSWARSLRFGGLQWATNFDTQPTLITFPQPSILGSAAVPTAMDIFVNGSLRSRQDLPDGTFRIEDIPVVTGAGQIQVVTRDIMGREQLVVQDFYASQQLLRPGLSDYAVSIGALRQNYGLRSNDYSDLLLSATLRRGLTNDLTLEGRLDASGDVQLVSGGIAYGMTRLGVVSSALAVSHERESGVLWQLGHQYQGRAFRIDLRLQGASDTFTQPGIELTGAFPKLQSLIAGGTNFGGFGTLGLSLIDEKFHDPELDRRLVTLSFARPLPENFSLTVSGSYVQADGNDLQASVLIMKYLGERRSASTSLQHSRSFSSARLEYRDDVAPGPGFGYRAAAYLGDDRAAEAEATWHNRHNRMQAEVRSLEGETGWRATLSGSVAWLGGDWYSNREIRDGFAVVDAGGFEGVRVYLENREMGVTDENGRLLLPALLPYQANRIRIESRDLPLSARLGNTQETVAPYYRSGTLVSFDVQRVSSALLEVTWPDGKPIPEGSEAKLAGRPETYPVGRNGRLFLPDLVGESEVVIRNHTWQCRFRLPNISRRLQDRIPHLGQFTCARESL